LSGLLLGAYSWVLGRLGYGGGRPGIERFLGALGPGRLVFFRAPTGYGKTTASLALGAAAARGAGFYDKVLHVLPLRSIIEDGYGKAEPLLGGLAAMRMMGASGSPFMLEPLVFVTVDTFLLAASKVNTRRIGRALRGREWGYDYFTQASVLASLVVLDEAHMVLGGGSLADYAYTVYRFLLESRVPVAVETATLPESWAESLRGDAVEEGYGVVEVGVGPGDPFYGREAAKRFRISVKGGDPAGHVRGGRRNLLILNTVARAAEAYVELSRRYGRERVFLIHGRMGLRHRRRVLGAIKRAAGSYGEYYVVATQVAEAGLDVSSDVLVTDVAPLMSLLQRMGRCARYGEEEGEVVVLGDAPTGMYEGWGSVLRRTVERLGELEGGGFHPRLPGSYQGLIDEVYSRFRATYDGRLRGLIADPYVRSVDVWRYLRRKYGGGVGRGLLLSIDVPETGDELPASLQLLRRLAEKGLVKLEVMEGGRWAEASVDEVVERALNWEPYRAELEPGVYDGEMGLVV